MKILMKFFVGAAIAAVPGAALAETPPEDFDRNGDKFLSGTEIVEYLGVLQVSPDANDARRYQILLQKQEEYASSGLIPISELGVSVERISCNFEQRVFLRKNVIDLPLAECEGLRPKSDGASFTLTQDRKANLTTVEIDGGIGLVLLPARTFQPNRDGNRQQFRLVDLAVSAFGEGNGTFETDADDEGYIRGGLKVDWLFGGGPLERLAVATAGYYQSDLGFDSGAYGVQVSLVPQNSDWLLNAYTRGKDAKTDFVIRAKSTFDLFHVDNAGSTALSQGDYAWFGGFLGLEYSDRTLWENGVVLNSGVNAFWNAVDGEDAYLWESELKLLLDAEGRTSFGLNYTRGTTRQNPVFQDLAKLTFNLKY
ncbi:hypothetical protein [Roseibium sp.]|uniref:hypothetical protein n=1 Tax=Roseibium sp. TaxID=1936156 RepID=UPI003BB208F6